MKLPNQKEWDHFFKAVVELQRLDKVVARYPSSQNRDWKKEASEKMDRAIEYFIHPKLF